MNPEMWTGDCYSPYLVAGSAAVARLGFVLAVADSIFRAIAPGVNQASGHADSRRNVVTLPALTAMAAGTLVYHLQLAAVLSPVTGAAEPD